MFFSKNTVAIIAIIVLVFFGHNFSSVIRPKAMAEESADLSAKKAEQQALADELARLEKEIAEFENQLNSVKSEKNTLNKKINELKLQQNKIKAQIRTSALEIKNIEGKLIEVEGSIESRQQKIADMQGQIADFLRLINQQDNRSLFAMMAAKKSVGEFFASYGDYRKIITGLKAVVEQITSETIALATDKVQLEDQKDGLANFISIKSLQNSELTANLGEHGNLLAVTKSKENEYQALVSERKKKAAEIKNRIYDLLGVSRAVTFGEAVEIAQWASSLTGVRTAFLLAILTQESNLGKNVGTCNRPGDPPEKSWKQIMKPERDQEPFLKITEELGLDPDTTPVSCPMRDAQGNRVGWGGAMGPAQFIPSTWMGYRAKVSAITGKSANPWDIRDAFLAAGILLSANGAGAKSGEWAAAMRYFSGGTNPKFRFYGDNVLKLAEKYEQDIKDLNPD